MQNNFGTVKVGHLRVQSLWVQEVASTVRLTYKKILGTLDPADALTKHVPGPLRDIQLQAAGV